MTLSSVPLSMTCLNAPYSGLIITEYIYFVRNIGNEISLLLILL